MENSISEYYNQYIKFCSPKLDELENFRLSMVSKIKQEIFKHIFIFFLLFIPLVIFILALQSKIITDKTFEFVIITLTALLFIGCIFYFSYYTSRVIYKINSINKDFKNKVKSTFLPILLKTIPSIKVSDKNASIDFDSIKKCEIFENLQTSNVIIDDLFVGEYKSLNFKMQECKLTQGNQDIFFQGIIFEIDSNKKIANTTILVSKNDIYTGQNSLITIIAFVFILILAFVLSCIRYDTLQLDLSNPLYIILAALAVYATIAPCINTVKNKEKFEKLNLEDPLLNKQFKAYSSNQIEGRYLLTTAFIDRFNSIKTVFGTNKIKCSFYKDKLYIAISTKQDLFEFGNVYTSIKNQNGVNKFYQEITSIYKLIEHLKMDNKTQL